MFDRIIIVIGLNWIIIQKEKIFIEDFFIKGRI